MLPPPLPRTPPAGAGGFLPSSSPPSHGGLSLGCWLPAVESARGSILPRRALMRIQHQKPLLHRAVALFPARPTARPPGPPPPGPSTLGIGVRFEPSHWMSSRFLLLGTRSSAGPSSRPNCLLQPASQPAASSQQPASPDVCLAGARELSMRELCLRCGPGERAAKDNWTTVPASRPFLCPCGV